MDPLPSSFDADVPRLFRQAVRYALAGGIGLVINVALLVVLVSALGVATELAPIVSLAVALTVTLGLVDRRVFARRRTRTLSAGARRVPAYYVVMGAGKLLNYGIYLVLTRAGVPYPAAWVLGAGVVFVGTFLTNRYLWAWSAVE